MKMINKTGAAPGVLAVFALTGCGTVNDARPISQTVVPEPPDPSIQAAFIRVTGWYGRSNSYRKVPMPAAAAAEKKPFL